MSRSDAIDLVKRATGMTVQTGLFSGMRMTPLQSWGGGEDIAPQLLGTYEQELHPTLARLMARDYRTVVNVGCAEGYYSVGLARCLPKAHVYAFDIDARARTACRANARENGVSDRVTINGLCQPEVLGEIAALDPDMLLVLDCETYELPLLTSEAGFAAVRRADLVIETHDWLDRSIVPQLMARFLHTHKLSFLHSEGRNPNAFAFLARISDLERWMMVCENRPELQNWLVCESMNRF